MRKRELALIALLVAILSLYFCTAITYAADSDRYKVVAKGATLIGQTKYRSKAGSNRVASLGDDPKYLCCSSFVSWCYTEAGVANIDYSTYKFRNSKKFYRIKRKQLLPGDIGLIQDKNKYKANHVAIYIGKRNGKLLWLHCTGRYKLVGVLVSTDSRLKVFYRYRGFED